MNVPSKLQLSGSMLDVDGYYQSSSDIVTLVGLVVDVFGAEITTAIIFAVNTYEPVTCAMHGLVCYSLLTDLKSQASLHRQFPSYDT